MNTDSLSFAVNAVANIVNCTLNRKHYKQQLIDIEKFVNKFGFECERHLYRCLFQSILTTPYSDTNRLNLLQQLYSDLGSIFAKPNFVTLLRYSLNKGPKLQTVGFESEEETSSQVHDPGLSSKINEIAKCLRLNETEKLAFFLCFDDFRCFQKEIDLSNCNFSTSCQLTRYILTQLYSSSNPSTKEVAKRITEDISIKIPSDKKESSVVFLNSPFSESIGMDSNISNALASLNDDQLAAVLISEGGTQLSSEILSQLTVTPKLLAKFLFALCENTRQPDPGVQQRQGDDLDVLANLCREFLPSASPLMDIIQAIDSESFMNCNNKIINAKMFGKVGQPFTRFWQFCLNLCNTEKQGVSILGALFFGKPWTYNLEFQFGFIVNCVKNQLVSKLLSAGPTGPGPGGGSIGDLSQLVPHLDSLKCQPDFEANLELNNWKYQKVFQILMDISIATPLLSKNNQQAAGSMFYGQILELFKWPIQQCPDLVSLGLLGCSTVCLCRNDLLSMAVPAFLSNHPNAAIILHTIWSTTEAIGGSLVNNNQWAKQVLLQSMCEYYIKSPGEEQQQRLSRILDVAQDLKALNLLLNSNCYPFVIDLACLASRREYLKLEKWLMDKIQSNGEPFITGCVSFLNRRCSALISGAKVLEGSTTAAASNLPSETLAAMLACLHQYVVSSAGNSGQPGLSNAPISQDLSNTILTMVANSFHLLQKVPRQPPPGVISNTSSGKALNSVQQTVADMDVNSLPLSNLGFTSQRALFNSSISNPQTQASVSIATPTLTSQSQQPERLRQIVGDLASIFPDMQQNVSPEIEKEADSYFQRIYNQSASNSMSIDEVLEMLRKFQDSTSKRERDIFTCMIRNLFKEYCYFPQYPDKELLITAQLFGGIIQMGLVKCMQLVVALRFVLEALRKPYGGKMYYFGIAALDRFKTKLKEYPLYCQHLASIPHYKEFPPGLIEYIDYGRQEPPLRGNLSSTFQQQTMPASSASPPASSALPASLTSVPGVNSGFGSSLGVGVIGSSNEISNTVGTVVSSSQSSTLNTPKIGNPPSGVIGPNPNSISTASVGQSTTSNSRPSIANATNIDTLLAAGETTYQNPPEAVQDKIAFIVNNLSQMNLSQKVEEFKEVIGKDDAYYGWISQYFVMKRASIEFNFHPLYANFLDMLKMLELSKLVIRETYRNIKVLLRSDKEIANFSDRSLLKNLGHWLGMLTLSKSKAVLAIDLRLKDLLIEAYHKGTQELLYVVPFIAKILESCAKSKVFKPPNPWTMGIVKALVELHQEPNLKLNLKFEVEVLCKTLNQDINELFGKSNILKDEAAAARVMQEPQLAGGVRNIPQPVAVSTSQSQVAQASLPQAQLPLLTLPQAQQTLPSLLSQSVEHSVHPTSSPTVQLSAHQQLPSIPTAPITMTPTSTSSPSMHLFNYHEINTSNVSGLAQHIVVNNNLPLFQINPALKQFIRPSIERAVTEWIQPVVERSIKISLTTAEQIIKKDFAMESDETKMCMAAQYLIRNLTAGMAMITSKETLFVTITTQLITAFTMNCGPKVSKELIEATANSIATDNIDLACCFIQKTAIEKAIPELDKRIAHEYEIRRKARNEGRRYCDPSVLTYQAERMPEAIRLKVGSVTSQQFQVYEELGKNIPGFVAPVFDLPSSGMNTSVSTSVSSLRPAARNLVASNFPLGQQLMQNLPSNVSSVLSSSTNLVSSTAISAPITVPPVVPPAMSAFGTEGSSSMDSGLITLYDKVVQELEQLLQQFMQTLQPHSLINTMHSILETVVNSRNNPRELVGPLTLIQRILEALNELIVNFETGMVDLSLLMRARDLYLVILKVLADPRAYGQQWTTKQITKIVLDRLLTQSAPTPPLPDELFDILIRSHLINISMMDVQLARLIENAQSPMALAFTMQFIKIYGPQGIHENDVSTIISALLKISKNSGGANPLAVEIHQILEVFRGSSSSTVPIEGAPFLMQAGVNQARDFGADPPEFLEKTERLLREWINLYHSTTNINKVFHMYVQSMNQHGILKTDDSITRFFRLSTEICVEFCYRFLGAQQNQSNQAIVDTRTKCFNTLDAFAHLIVMLVKHSGTSTGTASESTAKLNLLNKVLGIIASVVFQDQELRNEAFQHLAYYRIFIILFMELTLGPNNLGLPALQSIQSLQHQLGFGTVGANHLEPLYETIQFQVLNAFCQTLLLLKPSKAPSFAFAWLDFISHRAFLEKCLNGPNSVNTGASTKGWPLYAHLLIELIKFESPFLRNVELPQSVDLLYKGTLKVLLVLLHDFPEFLCEYCYELCDAIPCNAIQMRNLVLSAFPRNMRLPDPFTPNLKIDSLPEITQPPKGTTTPPTALANVSFKKDLDSYIRTRSPVTFLSELRGYLQHSVQNQPGDSTPYNIPLINALVLYVGQAAIQSITPKNISMSTIAHSSHMDIFQNLAVDLDTCGRYLFLNAIANQLRYPNSHTHYFSCTLLYLFAESNTEAIQEQITRVLLERLIVNRPHPWGLLVTFIELIKNPSFKFWNHEFVRCAPEIEKLFESVARSCMQQQQKSSHSASNSVQATGEV